ncbi:hypothetical protein EB796_004059 [Bugula neritina]|uniref:Uncharacterized protein n=1 Tax=Bugula neritina TaxID=10212 RepID=A0A7J7KIA7_BUGNE|nr:hypothetical protein EB796_004059 [Bugula neritina]
MESFRELPPPADFVLQLQSKALYKANLMFLFDLLCLIRVIRLLKLSQSQSVLNHFKLLTCHIIYLYILI